MKIEKYRLDSVMVRLFLFMLIGIYFIPAYGQDAVGIGTKESTPQASDNQCREFLVRTRAGLVSQLEEVIGNAQQIEKCLWGRVQNCQPNQETVLSELQTLQEVRNDIGAADISFDYTNRDYILLGNINRGLSNTTNRPIERLSEAERKRVWSRFETYQQEHIQGWLGANNHSNICLASKNDQFTLKRYRGSHMFVPELRKDIPRQHRATCHRFWVHTREAPYARDMLRAYRNQLPTQQEATINNRPPWLQFVSTRIDNKTRAERLRISAQAHNRYIAELNKLLRWLNRLPENDLSKILSMGVVQENLNGKEFCQDYSDQSWAELAGEIGLALIPGWGTFDALVFQIPQNNRNFIAGFTGIDDTRSANSNLLQDAAANAALAPFQAAAESVVVARVLGPIAIRSLQTLRKGLNSTNRLLLNFNYSLNLGNRRLTFHLTHRSKEHIDHHMVESENAVSTLKDMDTLDNLGRPPTNEELTRFYRNLQSTHRGRPGNTTTVAARDLRREVFSDLQNSTIVDSEVIPIGGGSLSRTILEYSGSTVGQTRFMLVRCHTPICRHQGISYAEGEVITFYPVCGPTIVNIPASERVRACSEDPPNMGVNRWRRSCRKALKQTRKPCR